VAVGLYQRGPRYVPGGLLENRGRVGAGDAGVDGNGAERGRVRDADFARRADPRDGDGGDPEHGLAEADLVAFVEERLVDHLAVEEGAVGAVEVAQDVLLPAAVHLGVAGGHLVVKQDDPVRAAAADNERGFFRP